MQSTIYPKMSAGVTIDHLYRQLKVSYEDCLSRVLPSGAVPHTRHALQYLNLTPRVLNVQNMLSSLEFSKNEYDNARFYLIRKPGQATQNAMEGCCRAANDLSFCRYGFYKKTG
ncbi:hypothetical protein MLD38_023345 [Melastoma candidum]|uniref:Uncharacterized protein n=1 Tax=Melastoma candidum TaxID=119954 RepID=A0ACB9QP16_9MYRT|nr:hypothetical protein MLD38_023345 [Melastoma candidum]